MLRKCFHLLPRFLALPAEAAGAAGAALLAEVKEDKQPLADKTARSFKRPGGFFVTDSYKLTFIYVEEVEKNSFKSKTKSKVL
jgi:hypothetical protein